MAKFSYKNWIIITLFIIVFGAGIFIFSRPDYKPGKPEDSNPEKTIRGPLVDSDAGKVVPLDQLGINTKDPASLASLGDKYFESNNFQQAIIIYEKVLELNPKDVDTYNDLGLALHYTGQSDSSIQTLKKGTEVVPSYQRIWLSLGFVLASKGMNEEAKPALKKAIEIDPNSTMGQESKRILGLLK